MLGWRSPPPGISGDASRRSAPANRFRQSGAGLSTLARAVTIRNNDSATINAAAANFRTEYDALGGGDYRLTFLGGAVGAPEYFTVNASNFRQKTGVIPTTSTEVIGTTTYAVALSEDTNATATTRAQQFVTMTFTPEGGGAPSTLYLSLAGVDSEGRVQLNPNISAASTLALGGVTFDRGSYDPATGVAGWQVTRLCDPSETGDSAGRRDPGRCVKHGCKGLCFPWRWRGSTRDR